MSNSLWLRVVLTCAMALPMLIFYAVGTLGPLMIADLGVPTPWLGWLITSTFGFTRAIISSARAICPTSSTS